MKPFMIILAAFAWLSTPLSLRAVEEPVVVCEPVGDKSVCEDASKRGLCDGWCCHPFFKKKTREEVCRRYFTQTYQTCGRCWTYHYVEITCKTEDSCGRVRLTRRVVPLCQ